LRKNPKVLARRWLAHAQFPGDEYPTDAVIDEIAVYLGRKVPRGIFEPREDLQSALVGDRVQSDGNFHIDSWLSDDVWSTTVEER
jgi:hypothetical protein